jgi:hypothetical protein
MTPRDGHNRHPGTTSSQTDLDWLGPEAYRRGMAPSTAALLYLVLVMGGVTYAAGWLLSPKGRRFRERVGITMEHARQRRRVTPASRPIELIAADVRRLGARYHRLDPRASFAKSDGVRRAYDGMLAECCAALNLTHLLGVIPPGPELDTERARVEGLLEDSGLRLPFAA